MREILFRGKRISTGEWVYGGILKTFHPAYEHNSEDDFLKQVPNCYCICTGGKDIFVEQESICQFTGLIDKNGKKIFEGDIVEGHCHSRWRHDVQRCEIAYGRDGFEARHYVQDGGGLRYYTYKVLFSKDVAVIGNIHDNPELLGGAEDA